MKKVGQNFHFGKRVATLRRQKGLSQGDLAKLCRVSRRVVAYYETAANNLPARLIKPLAAALNISTDELLEIKAIKHEMTKEEILLWRRFKKLKNLPVRDQKTVYSLIHALISKHPSKNGTN